MHELYAVELRASESNAAAAGLIEEWVARHVDGGSDDTFVLTDTTTDAGHRIWSLVQENSVDGTLWRSEVSIGPPDECAHVTVRIRLRAPAAHVAPQRYDFGSPAIVRTLIRELTVRDGQLSTAADLIPEIVDSGVEGLIDELRDPQRRLPIVVVSRAIETGATALTEPQLRRLARELAGLAHLRILSSSRASWRLTELVGQQLSVFDGAMRIYFPGFDPEHADPFAHRLYFADRITERTPDHLRRWLGVLAAAAIDEHPARRARRDERRQRLAAALEQGDTAEMTDLLKMYEEDNVQLEQDLKSEKEEKAGLDRKLTAARAEADALKYQLNQAAAARSSRTATGGVSEVSTVAEAMVAIEELADTYWYSRGVTVSDQARRIGRSWNGYRRPQDMVRAVQAVIEAGNLYHDDRLGMSPAEFFRLRGFGYATLPEPHLKIDEATSPDQCMRIYWSEDSETRTWEINSIGPHK